MPITLSVGARSIFVTATAWAFILWGALAGVLALAQEAAFQSLAPTWSPHAVAFSGLMNLLIAYLPWVLGAGAVFALATLASAIGLLLRLNWARRTFIGLLALAIVVNLLGLWLQQEVMQSVVTHTLHSTTLPAQALGVFGGFVTAARVMAVVVTLGGCALLAWIIRKLMSPGVRQEFA